MPPLARDARDLVTLRNGYPRSACRARMPMHATISAESTSEASAAPPAKARRLSRGLLLRLGLLALLAWPAWEVGRLLFLGNVHEVIPGKLYRGAQPSAQSLEAIVQKYKIRTVLNVRGCCWPDDWYIAEAAVCERLGVQLEDV